MLSCVENLSIRSYTLTETFPWRPRLNNGQIAPRLAGPEWDVWLTFLYTENTLLV